MRVRYLEWRGMYIDSTTSELWFQIHLSILFYIIYTYDKIYMAVTILFSYFVWNIFIFYSYTNEQYQQTRAKILNI